MLVRVAVGVRELLAVGVDEAVFDSVVWLGVIEGKAVVGSGLEV